MTHTCNWILKWLCSRTEQPWLIQCLSYPKHFSLDWRAGLSLHPSAWEGSHWHPALTHFPVHHLCQQNSADKWMGLKSTDNNFLNLGSLINWKQLSTGSQMLFGVKFKPTLVLRGALRGQCQSWSKGCFPSQWMGKPEIFLLLFPSFPHKAGAHPGLGQMLYSCSNLVGELPSYKTPNKSIFH